MPTRSITRRTLLQSIAVGAGAAVGTRLGGPRFVGRAFAGGAAADAPALLVVHLLGGYNALFSSAGSFTGTGAFGVSATNVVNLGADLVVDKAYASMSAFAKAHMASIGVDHGISAHIAAQAALWGNGTRNYGLMLAAAMGGDGPLKAVIMGPGATSGRLGPRTPESGVSLQTINDLGATVAALGGVPDATAPDRAIAAAGVTAARAMSKRALDVNPVSGETLGEAYDAAIATLGKQQPAFDYAQLATAYGTPATQTAVTDFKSQMVAAEVMIRAGANVVVATDDGWDSHGDSSGARVRGMMGTRILPALNTFLTRMLEADGRNVTVAILGDFSRSLPGSDHQPNLTATVLGKNVKLGTTGKVNANVGLPQGGPAIPQLWAYLAKVLHVPTEPFGPNPHALVL